MEKKKIKFWKKALIGIAAVALAAVIFFNFFFYKLDTDYDKTGNGKLELTEEEKKNINEYLAKGYIENTEYAGYCFGNLKEINYLDAGLICIAADMLDMEEEKQKLRDYYIYYKDQNMGSMDYAYMYGYINIMHSLDIPYDREEMYKNLDRFYDSEKKNFGNDMVMTSYMCKLPEAEEIIERYNLKQGIKEAWEAFDFTVKGKKATEGINLIECAYLTHALEEVDVTEALLWLDMWKEYYEGLDLSVYLSDYFLWARAYEYLGEDTFGYYEKAMEYYKSYKFSTFEGMVYDKRGDVDVQLRVYRLMDLGAGTNKSLDESCQNAVKSKVASLKMDFEYDVILTCHATMLANASGFEYSRDLIVEFFKRNVEKVRESNIRKNYNIIKLCYAVRGLKETDSLSVIDREKYSKLVNAEIKRTDMNNLDFDTADELKYLLELKMMLEDNAKIDSITRNEILKGVKKNKQNITPEAYIFINRILGKNCNGEDFSFIKDDTLNNIYILSFVTDEDYDLERFKIKPGIYKESEETNGTNVWSIYYGNMLR